MWIKLLKLHKIVHFKNYENDGKTWWVKIGEPSMDNKEHVYVANYIYKMLRHPLVKVVEDTTKGQIS